MRLRNSGHLATGNLSRCEVFGLEPDEERVLIANRVIGQRGFVQTGLAPDLPFVEGALIMLQ